MAGSGSELEAPGLATTLQGHVDDIRALIQCGICIRPLYEPFTLACGHTFCYSCLSSWFSGGRSKRTCPDCRAPVKTQPAPAYLVRAMVQMFTGRAELLDKGETTAEHSKNQKDEADKLDEDKANTNPSSGGLFGGLFKPKAPALKPVVDIEDGVMRCPHCNWELEDDEICGGCGWYYRPDSDQMTDYSDDYSDEDSIDDLEGPDSLDDEFEDEDDFGDHSFSHPPFFTPGGGPVHFIRGDPATLPHHIQSMIHTGRIPLEYFYSDSFASGGDVNDWTSEQGEEDEMGSFIDDDEHETTSQAIDYDSDPSTVVGESRASNQNPGPLQEYTIDAVLTDDSEDDDYESEIDLGSQGQPEGSFTPVSSSSLVHPIYYETRSPGQSEAGTTDVSRLEEEPLGSSEDDDDDDESDSETPSSPPPRRMQRSGDTGTSAGNAIAIDDSDDEDDQPVGPLRRAQRRRPRYSPY
ncbi:hypothetical protein N7474_008472 [Penicillium riverlandense]|uniref:uncharacterized protein n=1 Tax=Penicillium riverlandense TaxID=1903569 RepID=UPI002546D20B|nr:uncharacterized protein N7474_008472 [Penicillium riverlandense]KAJ5812171.1 hypothetical protein N7474_008472 [Penicillium riverlandense]